MLAVLGTDDGAPTSASVKFFNLSAAGPGGAEPSRICTVKLFSPKAADAAETTCLAVHIPEGWPSGSVAVGLRGGAVLLLTGNLGESQGSTRGLHARPAGGGQLPVGKQPYPTLRGCSNHKVLSVLQHGQSCFSLAVGKLLGSSTHTSSLAVHFS